MDNAVIIPVYKPEVTGIELRSLRRCAAVLGTHPIVFLAPEGLNLDFFMREIPQALCERFDEGYFRGITGHNSMLLSADYYRRMARWEYVLLYHLDSWVFRDELDFWCSKGYEHIGAPLFMEAPYERGFIYIGNGGFGLRKPEAFLRILSKKSFLFRPHKIFKTMRSYWKNGPKWRALYQPLKLFGIKNTYPYYYRHTLKTGMNEDIFWAELNREDAYDGLICPPFEEALAFSMEHRAPQLYEKNGRRLPFGCHGWDRVETEFWKKFINDKDQTTEGAEI